MKKIIFTMILSALASALSFAEEIKIISSEVGQQALIDERRVLTVFRDAPVEIDGQIGAYFDSSELETMGHDKLEWYYLRGFGDKAVTVETYKYDLKLPAYVSQNEERSNTFVQLSDEGGTSGIFTAHNIKIRLRLVDKKHISAEIEK